jgi:ABC-type glutathione transport system ATPase component
MRDMLSRAKILVVVSHDLGTLPTLCETGIWLDHGRVRKIGPMKAVVAAYKEHVQGPSATSDSLSDTLPDFREPMTPDTWGSTVPDERLEMVRN